MYQNVIFTKFFGNANENTKHIFTARLKVPNTPSFYFIRKGTHTSCMLPLVHGAVSAPCACWRCCSTTCACVAFGKECMGRSLCQVQGSSFWSCLSASMSCIPSLEALAAPPQVRWCTASQVPTRRNWKMPCRPAFCQRRTLWQMHLPSRCRSGAPSWACTSTCRVCPDLLLYH